MSYRVPFNRPFIIGKELFYIAQSVTNGNVAADGPFTRDCERFLSSRFGIRRVLTTPSCTAALEMAAMLLDLKPGDEVVLPSYTFVSTASAFARTGAKPVFVDIRPDTFNLDETKIEAAITPRTRAIVVVHYAGVGAEMDAIMQLAAKHELAVIEDAAQGVDAYYRGRPLGAIGAMGTFSFHETKNVICGEGGALCLNDASYVERAEIIRDKGTNRQKFLRGHVDKYTWVDMGSSYVPSEISSAFLWGQLEHLPEITKKRLELHGRYAAGLAKYKNRGVIALQQIPEHCQANGHMFPIVLPTSVARDGLMKALRASGVLSVFHYIPLHTSPMGIQYGYAPGDLPVTEDISCRLLRLPMFFELSEADQDFVINQVASFLDSL